MNATQRIRLGLLLTNLKLGGHFSFRTFVNDKDYPKDPDPKNWRTINGSKVHLSNGKIDGGAGEKFKGNEWHGKVAHGSNSFFPPKGWVKPPPPPKEPEPVPFGSEQPSPPKPNASGVPVAYINSLKGNFKKLNTSEQDNVKDLIKAAKKNGIPKELLEAAFEPEHHAVIEKTMEALKAKQITPTAAQNIIATAMYQPGHLGLKKLNEQWGGATTAAEDPFASKEVHLPKKKEPAAKSATTNTNKFIAEGIVAQMEMATSKAEQENILSAAGLNKSQVNEVMYDYNTDEYTGSNEAVKTLEHFLNSNEATSSATSSSAEAKSATTTGGKAQNGIDMTNAKEISQHWDDMDEDDQSKYLQDLSGKFNISTEKAALLMNLLQKPGFTDEKAEAKIKEWGGAITSTEQAKAADIAYNLKAGGPKAKAAGLMQTPNTCSVDLSEKATGIKTPKDTLNLVAAKGTAGYAKLNDPAFENFANDQAAQVKKLTKKQKAAIWRYTAGSTHTMKFLVYGETDDYFDDGGSDSYKYKQQGYTNPYAKGMTAAAIQKVCDDISAGLKKIKHPDMWVSRAASLMDWAGPDKQNGITLDELKAMAKSGEVFENKAFLSTSPSEVPTFSLGGSAPVCRRFFVPKKAAGGYIDSISEYGTNKGCHEYEFLLDKKTKTRIMKVEEVNGVIYTYEEVVV